MDRAIEQWSKACYGCQLVSQPEKVEPMTRTELPSRPWEHLAADFLGPLPSGDYIFAIVDYYSRWIDLAVMKSTTAEKMVDSLKQIFSTHGLPVSITTDNGPQFVSDHFKAYCEVNGIVHRKTTPLWPQANGEIERQNRSILKRLKIAQAEKKDWKSKLQTYLMMYRSAPHTTTGVSPAELLFNELCARNYRTSTSTTRPIMLFEIETLRERLKERCTRMRREELHPATFNQVTSR
jgi:transposase InsO family protein